MSNAYGSEHDSSTIGSSVADGVTIAPGKRTLTGSIGAGRASELATEDQHEVAAAAFAGSSSALPYQDSLESAFGRRFGDVQVYRDESASSALGSVHANAVTDGNRVAFRDPTPSYDTVAHELAHVVQYDGSASHGVSGSYGDREAEARDAADRASMGQDLGALTLGADPGGLHFDDPPFPFDAFPVRSSSPDMMEVNWSGTAGIAYPTDTPPSWSPTIAGAPPARPPAPRREPDWNAPNCGPGHHTEPSPFLSPGFESAIDDHDRAGCWGSYTTAAQGLSSAWNTVAPLHSQFELTTREHEAELRSVHNFRVAEGAGNSHSAANAQPAGRTGGDNPLAVGDLFHNDTVAGLRISTGTELDISAAGERGIDRAAGRVNDELEGVRIADSELSASVGEVRTAAADVRARELGVQNAFDRIEASAARRAQADATRAVASINDDIAEAKRTVKDVMNVVQGIAGIVGFAAAPAAAAGAAPSATVSGAGNVSAVAGSSAVESIAGRIIDAAYAERLETAQAALSAASARLQRAVDAEDRSFLATAQAELERALTSLRAKQALIPAKLAARRRAYETLATASARRSGAAAGSTAYNEVRGAVAAIPIVDTLVSRAEAARDAAVIPGYTARAGQGLGMATYHRQPNATEFVQHVGFLTYYRTMYQDRFEHWNARRQSLQAVVGRLADND